MNLLKILDSTPEPPVIDLHLDLVNQSGDYLLATPMYEFQKELTDQIVSLHYPDILKYCETNDSKELIVKSLEICVENSILVCTHPYLLINHYMPKNLTQKDLPLKLAETSGKFSVLKDLINVIIYNSFAGQKSIGIVMKNNSKIFDLVEALLLGCNGNKTIKRYVGNNLKKDSNKSDKNDNGSNRTVIHLIPGDGNVQKDADTLKSAKFDIIIVFDSSVDTSLHFFQKLRSQNRQNEAIIIRLMPLKTIEHCQWYYSDQKHQKDYLYKLISSIVCLRDFIGNLPPDIFPIYNQNLNYLSSRFFDQVFSGSGNSGFPPWPLPDLQKIPKFSATDVERSLLTEVHFHYTPYDSIDLANDKVKKPSFYESKRLELDYVTNPLKNDFNKLTGIHSPYSSDRSPKADIKSKILTHKLTMRLNNAYIELSNVENEIKIYEKYNEPSSQEKVGRRERELKQALSNIVNDVDHAESRIALTEKLLVKRTDEIADLKKQLEDTTEHLKGFIERNEVRDPSKIKFIKNQFDTWDLQDRIKNTLDKITSKNEEKGYTNLAYENSKTSMSDSKEQIESLESSMDDKKKRISSIINTEVEDNDKYKVQKKNMQNLLKEERLRNQSLLLKLDHSFKFLKDTSHLKKRKARGLTPNK
ncbi:uncharacterized protein PRCAT00002010001 [Priceomyces carsonii]|uniref:uncharacterized protein n=1 Tax=Priceomyces carsonii TaxID=28549 RepID=UPI002EDB88EA|nr:unnamed protein product [Priceomyces carsonii]